MSDDLIGRLHAEERSMSDDLIKRLRARTVPGWEYNSGGFSLIPGQHDALCHEAADEIEQLRDANEAFGLRQDWWTSTMFEMEQKVEQLRAIERRFAYLEAQFGWTYDMLAKGYYWELKPGLPRLCGETLAEAIDRELGCSHE